MATGDVHLSVEIGAWTCAAVYQTGGRRHPLTVDGEARVPSGVYLDPATGTLIAGVAGLAAARLQPGGYLTDPLALLHTGAPGSAGGADPAAAVTALLAHIADAATDLAGGPVTALTIVTEQAWGPRSRARLGQATVAAGLPQPHVVTAAAAASALADPPAEDGFVLVCSSGDAAPTLTVLVGSDHTELATATVRAPTQSPIDQALLTLVWQRANPDKLSPGDFPDWQTLLDIHRARQQLASQPRAAVVLPEPYPAVVLDRHDVTAAAQRHLDELDGAIEQLLDDADLDRAAITATVLVGGDGTVTDLHGALTEAGLPPATVVSGPHALADGGARLTRPYALAGATAATTRLPRTRVTVRNLAATAALAVCSVALLTQSISTAFIWTVDWGTRVTGIVVPTASVALAAALAAMSAFTAAQLAPTTWITPAGSTTDTAVGVLLRHAFLTAAGVGLALAGLWGLSIGVALNYYTSGLYLRWTIITTLPIVACAATVAVLGPRIPAARLTAWLALLRPPVVPIVVAAAGIYLVRSTITISFPANIIGFRNVLTVIGAAMLGAATAATATRQLMIRISTGTILALGYAVLADIGTAPYLTVIYIVALIWWVLAVTARTVREAVPGIATRWR